MIYERVPRLAKSGEVPAFWYIERTNGKAVFVPFVYEFVEVAKVED